MKYADTCYLNQHNSFADNLFPIIASTTIFLFIVSGLSFRSMPQLTKNQAFTTEPIRAGFVFQEEPHKKVAEAPIMAKAVSPKEKITQPIDLTEKKPSNAEVQPDVQQAQNPAKVRPVYGLRKVYSTGLGAGGSMADAVVGKLGNTLNKQFDTLIATNEEIKGSIVSATTVTSPPRFRHQVKPTYTKDMLTNRVEGVIRVKALVDIDGKVKQATLLNDLGFDSANQALKATLAMEFSPAFRGEDAVAVWIVIPIRFVMMG